MKLIKGLGLLSFLGILSGSCFDPPEFPATPQIEYENIQFIGASEPGDFDTLNLFIKFKDGDGNLGFNESSFDISDPFHDVIFYQEDNQNIGQTIPLSLISGFVGEDEYDVLQIPDPNRGKLVTFRTREKAGFGNLPDGEVCSGSNNLKHYEYLGSAIDPNNQGGDGRRLLILAKDRPALGPGVKLVDSIPKINPQYYQIRDTLYFTPNPDHYNIEVDFLVKDPSAPDGFTEFDWREEFCTTFDGRFPVFSDNGSSIDGTLKYSMTSLGFRALFSIKTLKLRVSIKDRLRNRSNVITTPEFTL